MSGVDESSAANVWVAHNTARSEQARAAVNENASGDVPGVFCGLSLNSAGKTFCGPFVRPLERRHIGITF